MAVHRTAIRPDGFTMIPNEWIRDTRLNGNNFRVLAYIASHRIGYKLTVGQIESELNMGREAVRNAMKALEASGYLSRVQQRGPGGRLAEVDYNLADPFDGKTPGHTGDGSPVPGESEKPEPDPTMTGNPTGDGSPGAGSPGAGSPDPLNKTMSTRPATGANAPARTRPSRVERGEVVDLFGQETEPAAPPIGGQATAEFVEAWEQTHGRAPLARHRVAIGTAAKRLLANGATPQEILTAARRCAEGGYLDLDRQWRQDQTRTTNGHTNGHRNTPAQKMTDHARVVQKLRLMEQNGSQHR